MQLADILTAATGVIVVSATALLWRGALRKIHAEEGRIEEHRVARHPVQRRAEGERAVA